MRRCFGPRGRGFESLHAHYNGCVLMTLDDVYKKFCDEYDIHDKWWPVSGDFVPRELEIVIGAILTQNTNWRNVEKALGNMVKAGLVDAQTIAAAHIRKIESAVRPSGFFRQKAKRVKEIARFISSFENDSNFYKDVTREQLLGIKGIGKETADSILLYACDKPIFVVDAYTWRIFFRYGLLQKEKNYDDIQNFFESKLEKDADLYKKLHALIVEHAKRMCRKQPLCDKCVLKKECQKRGLNTG